MKKVMIFLMVALLAFSGCGSSNYKNSKQVTEAFIEALNKNNLKRAKSLCADESFAEFELEIALNDGFLGECLKKVKNDVISFEYDEYDDASNDYLCKILLNGEYMERLRISCVKTEDGYYKVNECYLTEQLCIMVVRTKARVEEIFESSSNASDALVKDLEMAGDLGDTPRFSYLKYHYLSEVVSCYGRINQTLSYYKLQDRVNEM